MSVSVEPVQSRRQRREFVEFAWQLYQNDPKWVPPIRSQQEQLLGWRKHAFYDRAESQAFLARRGGEVVGRVLAIVNRAHIEVHNEEVGFFGFFESVDDLDVAASVLDAAKQWLSERGIQRMRGPVNPSLNHDAGLLVQGFDMAPYFMMTYNPSYYLKLLRRYGCTKAKDLVAYAFFADDIPGLLARYRTQWQLDDKKSDVTIRNLAANNIDGDTLKFLELYNQSLEGLWGSVPLSPSEIKDIVATMRWLLVPELVTFAERDNQVIGAAVCLLDFNPVLRRIDGRLFPFGFVQLLRGRNEIKRGRLLAVNIADDFQILGFGGTLLAGLLPGIKKHDLNEIEVSWVLEDNKPARRSLETAGGQLYKRYRIYECS